MKAVNCTWIVVAVSLLLLTSCTQSANDVFQDTPDLNAKANSQLYANVSGMDGLYSSVLDDCVPPNGNCISSAKIAPGKVYFNELQTAVNAGKVQTFLNTEKGKLFLDELDPRVAADLLNGKTTVKEYFGRHFTVFHNAATPYDGPDYGKNGSPIKAADIPN